MAWIVFGQIRTCRRRPLYNIHVSIGIDGEADSKDQNSRRPAKVKAGCSAIVLCCPRCEDDARGNGYEAELTNGKDDQVLETCLLR